MSDLDMLLTIVGVGLIVIGVGVFLLGKSKVPPGGERSNIFEAFGIKLNVSNPSVLLIMFGVVLMLAPRFLPLGDRSLTGLPLPASQTEVVLPSVQPEQAPVPPAPVDADRDAAAAQAAQAEAQRAAEAQAAAEARAREQVALEAARRELARQQAALADERSRLAAQDAASRAAAVPPAAIVKTAPVAPARATAPDAAAATQPTLVILTEALNYEGETDGSLRAKMHVELRTAVADTLADKVQLDLQNPGFRGTLRVGDMALLCKRTHADHLLLADLTPVVVESSIESANWPNMRYSAVRCDSGRVSRSDWMRMEPTVGDRFPLQQSVASSARDFIRTNRHLLQ